MAVIENVGGRIDYAFGCAEGWDPYEVVRFHAVEEISRPFEFDVVLLRRAERGQPDLDELLNAWVSLRIASSARWRLVHGIVVQAEEIERTSTFSLVRAVIMPPIVRARYRRRCRNFVDKTLSEIFATVLENRSPAFTDGNQGLAKLSGALAAPPAEPDWGAFTPPTGQYRMAITDTSRIEDASLSPYIVQYNEADFDFLSRLLEKEGISYYFEHTADAVVMTLTDEPGQSPLFAFDARFPMRGHVTGGSATREQEAVRSIKDARRMATRAVTVREFDWNRSRTPFDAQTSAPGDADVFGVFEFLGEDENNPSSPGAFPSRIRAERFSAESALCDGAGSVRSMEPGYAFTLTDEAQLRPDVELLVVRVETYASILAPEGTVLDEEPFSFHGLPAVKGPTHTNRFVALPTGAPFRPAMRTPKTRIHGIHSAIVTAEEFGGAPPEINADKNGSVRLRFPWDQRADTSDGSPSSQWVRVSHAWAGAGFGGMCVPRVGQEVLVAYVHGDPDRPVVIGRVYNPQTPPPYDASEQGVRTTMKSQSSPNAAGFNEIRFDDSAGTEEVFVNAQYDYNEVVGNNQNITVLNDQHTTVNDNQTITVIVDQTTTVMNIQVNDVAVDRNETIGANDSHTIGGAQTTKIAGDRTTNVGATDLLQVGADRNVIIGAGASTAVGAHRVVSVAASNNRIVSGPEDITIGGARTVTVSGAGTERVSGAYNASSGTSQTFAAPHITVNGAATIDLNTATLNIKAGGAQFYMSDGCIEMDNGAGSTLFLVGGCIELTGAAVYVNGKGGVDIGASADVNVKGANVKLNG